MTAAVVAAEVVERCYGIRHHGPGSARAVLAALDEQRPDIVLVEGPPEADELVGWAADEALQPPVALLGYATDDPRRAAYWPFAVFSPEWQAIRWAVRRGVPVRFIDLPYALQLGPSPEARSGPEPEPGSDAPADEPAPRLRPVDPIGELAAAAGYDDSERWWEDVVEHRELPAFEAIAEAMAAIRATAPEDPRDLLREAHMRTVLRQVRRTHRSIAIVCGAWHVPALTAKVPASHDAALLKGRRKAAGKSKVGFTWVPWTYGRLASWRGYGAGVSSPGWYHHLFSTGSDDTGAVVTRWMVAAAGVLREEGVPASSAHVIEAVRLAEALATLRGRPLAGLSELTEAGLSVLCEGDELRSRLIERRLVVGERLGAVPDDMPATPLARDLAAQQRSLRLKPEALERELDLDLRRAIDLGRSRLLHRLRLLGVPWGEPTEGRRNTGTFREAWRLCWQPEFAVAVVDAGAHGTTVVDAATAKVVGSARGATVLAEVTALVEACLVADLAGAFGPVLRALDTRAALDTDVAHLLAAVPALARTLRYGDVRGTDVGALRTVTTGLLGRACAGLPAAVLALSDEAAAELRTHIDGAHGAIGLLDDDDLRERWFDTLASLVERDGLHGLLAGRLTRLLHDAQRLDRPETGRRMARALSVGVAPAAGAAWVEGFLAGGGLLLVHDPELLSLVDGWLAGLGAEAFTEAMPLLRRTFGTFAEPERRAIGERVRGGGAAPDAVEDGIDHDLAERALPTISALLGREVTV
ncbi:DUF5682 family protein [Pseudonocardia lacus]|uniref:DUF5682 family protein n=1 Tax=Pseudonocardia lacus TaxID=2835865 RepID=UPI0027E39B29|nr:DUF5682 family protein [Pseudonocardia lacus]